MSFAEILRAADDVGMLVSLSQPHSGQYDWKAADADQNNGYAQLAEFYVRVAQSHPSVVFYSMNHNATSYCGDMDPDTIDGVTDPRDKPYNAWARNNTKLALRAEAIVKRLDPSRIVYHHASGNLSSMWTSNFYPNFVPIQEMSDWFEHWATEGQKPAFTCEFGAPFTYDWAMFRGWYKGKRSFGEGRVPWEYCFAEWNAQYLGDRAYKLCEAEKANIRREAKLFKTRDVWTRWDFPYELGSRVFDDRFTVMGQYIADNWRAFRTWGLSANSPWEHVTYWKPRDGVDKGRKQLKVDWDNLQRPGFSPDYLQPQGDDRMDINYDRSDWVATAPAQALLRNNMPLLGLHRRQAQPLHEQGSQLPPRRNRRASSSSSSTIRASPSPVRASVRLACRKPSRGASRSPSGSASRSGCPCDSSFPPTCVPENINSPRQPSSATARRNKTPSRSMSCRCRSLFKTAGRIALSGSQGRHWASCWKAWGCGASPSMPAPTSRPTMS